MLNKNNSDYYNDPNYYNDAVRDARVNHPETQYQNNAKGKLLLILNLTLISTILGYFIYQNIQPTKETAVLGVNYTVDIKEEIEKTPMANSAIIISKSTDSTDLEKVINSSQQANSAYINALDKEIRNKENEKSQNQALQNILENVKVEEFKGNTNVIKKETPNQDNKELDIDALANVVNSLVSKELSKTIPTE